MRNWIASNTYTRREVWRWHRSEAGGLETNCFFTLEGFPLPLLDFFDFFQALMSPTGDVVKFARKTCKASLRLEGELASRGNCAGCGVAVKKGKMWIVQ